MQKTRILILAASLAAALTSTGCEWLQDEGRGVLGQYVTLQREFTISLPQFPVAYPTEFLPDGDAITEPQRVPFNTPMVGFDLSSATEFDVQGIDVIDRIELASMEILVDENTLNIPMEAIEIRFGGDGQNYSQAVTAAATDPITPGTTGTIQGEVIAQNNSQVTALLTGGNFRFGLGTEWVLNEGPLPEGRATIKIRMTIRVVIVD
jgi:hypothetical protein